MKNLAFLLSLFLSATSLFAQNDLKTYTIQIEVDSAVREGLNVKLFSYELDTSMMLEEGVLTMTFSGETDHVTKFNLLFSMDEWPQEPRIYVYDDTARVSITVDKNDPDEVSFNLESRYTEAAGETFDQGRAYSEPVKMRFLRKVKDTHYMDSMVRNVLPEIQETAWRVYDRQAMEKVPIAHQVVMLDGILKAYYASLVKFRPMSAADFRLFTDRLAAFEHLPDGRYPELDFMRSYVNDPEDARSKPLLDVNLLSRLGYRVPLKEVGEESEWTLMVIWATWCGPCHAYNAAVEENYDDLVEAGVNVVRVNADAFEPSWLAHTDRENLQGYNLYTNTNSKFRAYYNRGDSYPKIRLFRSGTEYPGVPLRSVPKLVERLREIEAGEK